MATRRMFSKKITDTDMFLDLPLSAQALYFHLNMHADDDGFVDNVKTLKRMVGSSEDDLKLLLTKQFIIVFDDGITVIKDWRVHNYLRKDRYTKTTYQDHKKELMVTESGSYQRLEEMSTNGIPAVDQTSPQVRLGKDRLDKSKDSIEQPTTAESEEQKPVGSLSVKQYSDKIVDFYQFKCNLGQFSPVWYQDLDQDFADWLKLNDNPEEVTNIFCLALKETAGVKDVKKPYKYAQGILDNWERNKHVTLSDIKAELVKKESGSSGKDRTYNYRKRSVVQKEQLPDWAGKEHEDQRASPEVKADLNKRMEELGLKK